MQVGIAHLNPDEVIATLRGLKDLVREKFKAEIVGIFGSVARREQTSESDLDVLVRFKQGATLFDVVELEYFLEEKFSCKVDVVSEKTLKPRIRSNVMQDLILLQ